MSAWFTKRACAVAFAVCIGSALVPAWAQGEIKIGYNADQSGWHSRIRHLRARQV